jgi:hypothetical protein
MEVPIYDACNWLGRCSDGPLARRHQRRKQPGVGRRKYGHFQKAPSWYRIARNLPQGPKPSFFAAVCGTTEVVPCYKALKICVNAEFFRGLQRPYRFGHFSGG